MKKEVLVRFANESYHSTVILVNPANFKDVVLFPREVFATIDGVRVAMLREEYENATQDLDIAE